MGVHRDGKKIGGRIVGPGPTTSEAAYNPRAMSSSPQPQDPVFPGVAMHLVPPSDPLEVRVFSSAPATGDKPSAFVRHLVLDVSGTPLEGAVIPGQSFGVIPPGTDDRGLPHKVRLYSIASPSWGEDGHPGHIATTPKRTIVELPGEEADAHRLFLGVCSNFLCDLVPGDPVMISGPNGKNFILPEHPGEHDYLFLATGTGIAPYRGMIMELLHGPGGPVGSRIDLVMGVPYATDLLYDEYFTGCAAEHENFHYHTAISREPGHDDGSSWYVHNLVKHQWDEHFASLLHNPRTLIYVCGIAGMQVGLFRLLAMQGIADQYLKIRDEETAGMPPEAWDTARIRRHVRHGKRCRVEVY